MLTVATRAKAPVQLPKKASSAPVAMRSATDFTAETVIGALEDAEDYQAFEAAITADYDAQSAVERELVLRLASLLWRLHRATTIETGLFEIQANHLTETRRGSQLNPASREVVNALFRRADAVHVDPAAAGMTNVSEEVVNSGPRPVDPHVPHTVEFARCFLRLANLPNFALDRLSRYEATLWRQLRQTFFPSMPWIAANHRKEADVSLSTAGQHCRRLRTINHTRHCATKPTVDHKSSPPRKLALFR